MMLQDFKTAIRLMRSLENWIEVIKNYIENKELKDIETKFRRYPIFIKIKNPSFCVRPSHLCALFYDVAHFHNFIEDNIKNNDIYIKINKDYIELKCSKIKIKLPCDIHSLILSLPRWIVFLNANRCELLKIDNNPSIKIFDYTFYLPDVKNGIYEIVEVFIDEVYNKFNFKRKKILDIGGFIGDTAIYFVHKGASYVEVYEPNPFIYSVLKKNIETNNLLDKIRVVNAGIGNSDRVEEMIVPWYGAGNIYGIFADNSGNLEKIKVKIINFNKVMNKYFDIVKIDCEGCEYEILDQVLQLKCEGIILEAHYINQKLHPKYIISMLKRRSWRVNCKDNIIWCERTNSK